ncbi:MAG: hypothetical protein ACO1Q7_09695 [Gemmatimonas sp.]
MSPAVRRRLRSMSTVITLILVLAGAGGVAWMVRRLESRSVVAPSECSTAVDAVLARGTGDTPDSLILNELLIYQDRCIGDGFYVDQTRRLLTNLQQPEKARALIEAATRTNAMTADDLAAQHAWIDAAESQQAWANNEEARAKELYDRAVQSASTLRDKWPEWSQPYRILKEASRSGISPTRDGGGEDYFQLERNAARNKLNGAWFRSLTDWQPIAFAFGVSALAFLAFAAGMTGLLDWREMTQHPTSDIANVQPGYVELKGTLHAISAASSVIAPLTKTPALWYEESYNSGMKKATTRYTRSGERFILRDATGEVRIDPEGITVRTRHSKTRFGNAAGQANGSRTTEDILKEGDTAFALGELTIKQDGSTGKAVRLLTKSKDGRKLLVSNYSEAELIWMEKMWFAIGMTIFAAGVIIMAWAYVHRYQVRVAPGVL